MDGEPYTLRAPAPPGPARVADAVAAEDWVSALAAYLDEDDTARLFGRLGDPWDALDLPDLWRIARGAVAEMLGVEWHVGVRLLSRASGLGFAAWAAKHAFDCESASLPRIVGAALAYAVDGCADERALRRLEAELWAPPPYDSPEDEAAWAEGEAASFAAASAALSRPLPRPGDAA
ncbi:hypothetical protein [Bailinhaonella thermotolerans]|uniref:hypothetical protein n=1 Tax=Bailinhaonella thermotolerans TaxID=1070861 RepID=UPI001A8F62AB|nr:hypothetical protein [Bailinhaonella thermotolerans]